MTPERLKHLVYKHHNNRFTRHHYDEATAYIKTIKDSLLRELDKLETELEYNLKLSHGHTKTVESAERNYVHWRHILVSVLDSIDDAQHHWDYQYHKTNKLPHNLNTF